MRFRRGYRRAVAVALVGTGGLFQAGPANATWPMGRHDAKRLGAATGTGNLAPPTAYWRAYLGGAITGPQLLVADVAGSGSEDLLFANTGQLIANDPTGAILWQSPTLGLTQFSGIADVNGDGIPDVVAQSTNQVYVFSLRTGAIEWAEPVGEMGTIGVVRIGDVNGDGKPDILIVECGSCGVSSGNTGFYWTFANGFASAAHLGAIPASTFTGGTFFSTTLVSATASSAYETLLANDGSFTLLDGAGNVLAQTGLIGTNLEFSQCETENIDGVPGDEAICLLNSSLAPATNQRRISVFHYNYSAQPPALDVLWSKVVAPDAGGNMQWVDPLQDLDGDGHFEVVASTDDPANGWQTHVYDALTGVDLVSPMAGQTIVGTAALESATSRVLLTSNGPIVTASLFSRSPSPSFATRWTEPSTFVLTYPNVAEAQVQSIDSQVLATDLNGDGLNDVVLQSSSGAELLAFSGAGGHASQFGILSLPADVDVLTAWVVPGITLTVPQVALARSDGIVNLLDDHLQPTSSGTPATEVDLKVGGYYATGAFRELYHTPRVVPLGTGPAQSVLVDDSRQALLRIDATTASLAVPPPRTWQVTHTFAPTFESGLSPAGPAMACLALTEPVTNPPQYRARIVNADGSLGWDVVLSGIPLNDLAPGMFNADGVPDFATQLGSASTADLTTVALSGVDGSLLWSTAPVFPGPGGTQSSGLSVDQFGSGPPDDIYYQGEGTFVLSGAAGTQLAAGGPVDSYFLPMLFDTTGSGQDEVILTAGESPVSIYSHDLQTAVWGSTDNDKPYPYAALAQCPGTPTSLILVEGSWAHPARLKLTPLNGTSVGTFTTVVLAGGRLYPDESAASGAFLGQLTAANVHSNLTGQNRPSAVVGSSDGWLYGVNPCSGSLDFAAQIGAQVGEAVFGDTDGDGNDEILVTAADGYLYDFKGFSIAAPMSVLDTDPPLVTNSEVSTIVTTNRLSATWTAVPGALSYAVEVVTTSGGLVSTPSWKSVGTATSTSLTGLPLQNDTKYRFAVRAIGQMGPSVDALSPGVTVYFPDGGVDASADGGGDAGDSGSEGGRDGAAFDAELPTDAAFDAPANQSVAGGGCGCQTIGSSALDWWRYTLVGLGAVLAVYRRRRRTGARHAGVGLA